MGSEAWMDEGEVLDHIERVLESLSRVNPFGDPEDASEDLGVIESDLKFILRSQGRTPL